MTTRFGQDVDTQATAAFVRMWRECKDEFEGLPKQIALLVFKVGFTEGMKEGTARARDMLGKSGESHDKSG